MTHLEDSAKSLCTDQDSFQKSAASFHIHSVLVSLLFIIKSPNIRLSTILLSLQRSKKAEIGANGKNISQSSHLTRDYYTYHKPHVLVNMQLLLKPFLYSHQPMQAMHNNFIQIKLYKTFKTMFELVNMITPNWCFMVA